MNHSRHLHPESRGLVLLMSAFVALGPLSTDMYLPALPTLVSSFDTSLSRVQLTISSYLVGFAVFHLLCGPLADRYGRKPILLAGMLIFLLASIGCALATSVEELMFYRFLQGIGGCTGPTLARAMIRDIYGPLRSARVLAYMAAIMALAPVIAPTLGGWMLIWMSWTSIFWFLAAYSALGILTIALLLPESNPFPQSMRPAAIFANYAHLIKDHRYLLVVLALSSLYAGAFAFISGSSFVLIDYMGVRPEHFGLWFMLIVAGYMAGSIFTGRRAQDFAAHQLTVAGALLGVFSGGLMLLLYAVGWHHPLAVVLPMSLYTAAVGVAMPQAMSVAMAPFPRMAGTASSLMGFIQMGLSALAGIAVGLTLVDNPMPMAITITLCALLSTMLFAAAKKEPQII